MTGQKILIVEDHKDTCLWISAVLRQTGFASVEASDGAVALRMARNERPDLIVLDMHMPCGGGMFVLESLRKQESLRRMPVIIMSGDLDLDREKLEELGAVEVFTKPVDVHAFLAAVKEWAGKEVPELATV
jgi:CheY-like chemotaxis protein